MGGKKNQHIINEKVQNHRGKKYKSIFNLTFSSYLWTKCGHYLPYFAYLQCQSNYQIVYLIGERTGIAIQMLKVRESNFKPLKRNFMIVGKLATDLRKAQYMKILHRFTLLHVQKNWF